MPRASRITISGRSLSEIEEKLNQKDITNGDRSHVDLERFCIECNLPVPANDKAVLFFDDDQDPEKIYDDGFRYVRCFKRIALGQKMAYGLPEDATNESINIENLLQPCKNHPEYNLLRPKKLLPFICVYGEPKGEPKVS